MATIQGFTISRLAKIASGVSHVWRRAAVSLIIVAFGVTSLWALQILTPRGVTMAVLDPKTGWTWLGSFTPGTWVKLIAFSPDGKYLATGDGAGIVNVWDRSKDRPVSVLGDQQEGGSEHKSVHALAFDSGGTRFATGGFDGRIYIYGVPGFRRLARLDGPTGVVDSLVFSPDGRALISAGSVGDGAVRLWNLESRRNTRTFTVKDEDIKVGGFGQIAVNPEGRIAAVYRGGMRMDGAIYLLDRDDLTVIRGRPCECDATFSPGAKYLVSASTSGNATVFDANSLALILEARPGPFSPLYSPALSPDAKLLAFVSGDTSRDRGIIQLYDLKTRGVLRFELGPQREVLYLTFSPDGRTLAAGCHGGQVVLIPIDAEPK